MDTAPPEKKAKLEVFDIPIVDMPSGKTSEEIQQQYESAIQSHPFYDNAHSLADIYDDCEIRDGNGNVLAVLFRKGLPDFACKKAADVLRTAATKTSLRSSIYGGDAPQSGIAGYFDYRGSPIEFKYRKTSFTHEHSETWHDVFPMVDYVSQLYKKAMPECWRRQDAAIPDVVRIHNSPFSTLTINSRFRTASHTDAGDFDDGYGCIACLEGQFKGLSLTFDNFRVNVCLYPSDVLVFNTHHFHSNTELEAIQPTPESWSRLTCVFYYRSLLGEAPAYEEYKRRLRAAQQQQQPEGGAALKFRSIEVKKNGVNLCRPDEVFPIVLSPFSVIASLFRFKRYEAHCLALHAALHDDETLQQLLFGELLATDGGIPARAESEKVRAVLPAAEKTTGLLGARETGDAVQAATEKEKYLNSEYLAAHVSEELAHMWEAARAKWLGLVSAEWARLVQADAGRTQFTWNNRSEMNAAFFDLCEVAKQLLLGLLRKETVTRSEETFFWTLFATHLNKACATELGMPAEAMSLRKLSVKVKDFNFGGTRYLKDMPPEEKLRRAERKARIEAARKQRTAARPCTNWLTNDSFDYQSEDRDVDYAGNGWPLPEAHAAEVFSRNGHATTNAAAAAVPPDRPITVLLVLPTPSARAEVVEQSPTGWDSVLQQQEWNRLMENKAARNVLSGAHFQCQPCQKSLGDGALRVTVCYARDSDNCGSNDRVFDFVIAQHVLCQFPEASAARAQADLLRRKARIAFLSVETDLECRYYYTLKQEIREAYDAVASGCYRELLRCRFSVQEATVRPKRVLEELLGCTVARYKLSESPLNSMVLICPPL